MKLSVHTTFGRIVLDNVEKIVEEPNEMAFLRQDGFFVARINKHVVTEISPVWLNKEEPENG